MIVMSIDPGLSGAIAVFEGGALIEIIDMPTHELTRNGKAKRQIHLFIRNGVETTRLLDNTYGSSNNLADLYHKEVSQPRYLGK